MIINLTEDVQSQCINRCNDQWFSIHKLKFVPGGVNRAINMGAHLLLFLSCMFVVSLAQDISQDDDGDRVTAYGPLGYTAGEPIGSTTGSIEDEDLPIQRTLQPPSICNNTDLERNKRHVMDFYQTALREKRADLMKNFLAEDYLNHNPFSNERGREDFVKILTERQLAAEPSQTVEFHRVDAIDDRVWVHCSFNIRGRKFAVMDIFQVNCDGLFGEHWDVLQDTTSVPTKNPVAYF